MEQRTEDINENHGTGQLTSDYDEGERLDTHVEISLDYWIAGNQVGAFKEALRKLYDEFAI